MTSRWYPSRGRIFFLTLAGLVFIVMIVLIAHHIATPRSEPSHLTTPSWQNLPGPPLSPTASGAGQVVESEPVRPNETPPSDTSPGGSGSGDGKAHAARDSTLRLPEVIDDSGSSRIVSSVSDGNISTNSIISNNLGNDSATRESKNSTTEDVYITKVLVQPLHQDDLLYQSKTNVFDGRHATGAFRSTSSIIWDPHPEYKIDAFGISMHLKLWQDNAFIGKDMKVTHFWPNSTLRKPEDHDENLRRLQGCFYAGKVEGEPDSSIRVSLCEGMQGHIQTSYGSFLIQPVESGSNSDVKILHRIQRLMTDKASSGPAGRTLLDRSTKLAADCAVQTDHDADRTMHAEPADHHSRHRRSADNFVDYGHTIEVLVAVDSKMLRYHNHTLKSYVLTLMSIVSSVYADASIGNSIKIAVSHIMYIHHDLDAQNKATEKGLEGVSASDMLQDFCHYKQRSNFQHDVALLLTREQICRNPAENNCDTLGLAELGTICRETACAIVKDNGLSAAFTIAHELGHVLGMPHDDDKRCDLYRGKPSENNRIMSRTIDHNTHPWQWSNCSRQILTEYLEKHPDNCLLNQPAKDLIAPNEMDSKLAGEKFTNNEQCELVFGEGSKICSYMPVCTRLWCSWENEMAGCKTQHMPWADGTECSKGHWCQKGQCVRIDRSALKPQDGGWNVWSPYSACSRSCGGGIQKRTRECDSPKPMNGGKFCTGTRFEYATCNTHPCPESSSNFREQQCRELNGQSFNVQGLDSNVQWVPKYGTLLADQCKLFCRVQDKSIYFMLREKVIDGTPCTFPEDSFDMCVNGQCRKVGCDYVLNSDAKLDQCGKCRGDNSTCSEVKGYLLHGKHSVPHKVPHDNPKEFNIPEGATNINIVHAGYVRDVIFLTVTNGTEIIFNDPSDHAPYTNKHRMVAGVRLEYIAHGNQERITSTFGRPLKEKLTVRIVHRSHSDKTFNSQVNYSYLIPTPPSGNALANVVHHHHHQHHHAHHPSQTVPSPKVSVPPAESSFRWEMSAWLKCDQQCRKRRTGICVNAVTQQKVSPELCNQSVKPQDDYDVCNSECKFGWKIREECSSTCGEGITTFQYRCIRTNHELNAQEDVDPALCSVLPKPWNNRSEKCVGPCKNATLQYSQWNKCSCSDGTKNRTAICLSEPNGFQIDDQYCKERKDLVLSCSDDELKECAEWVTGEPTPCSVTCGEGQRAYAVQCMIKNVTVNAALCGTRPLTVIMNCTMPPCERKQLPNTQYSSFRNDVQPNHSIKTVNYLPNTELSPAPVARWRYSSYSNCSADCKGGFKTRTVRCISERTGQQLDERYCPQPKPATQINCRSCPSWVFGQWTKVSGQEDHGKLRSCERVAILSWDPSALDRPGKCNPRYTHTSALTCTLLNKVCSH